jgi:hypothetical protein
MSVKGIARTAHRRLNNYLHPINVFWQETFDKSRRTPNPKNKVWRDIANSPRQISSGHYLALLIALICIHGLLLSGAGVDVIGFDVSRPFGIARPLVLECLLWVGAYSFLQLESPGSARPLFREVIIPTLGFLALSAAYEAGSDRLERFDNELSARLSSVSLLSTIIAVLIFIASFWICRPNGISRCLFKIGRVARLAIVGAIVKAEVSVVIECLRSFPSFTSSAWNIPARPIWLAWASCSLATFLLVAVFPDFIAGTIGSLGIIFLAMSNFLILAGVWRRFLGFIQSQSHLPAPVRYCFRWSWLLLIIWIGLGLSHNGHYLRTNTPSITEFWDRTGGMNTEIAVRKWAELNRNSDGKATLVVVATAGGGIRAAYWTAMALSKLNEIPDFRRHLFAISSVSGGSLGAALFRASLTAADRNESRCKDDNLPNCYRAFLSHDFLAPLLAGWLFSDAMTTLIPFLPLPDRANAIERAWETAWKEVFGDDLFAGDFSGLWPRRSESSAPQFRKADLFPALILNVTSLKSGLGEAISSISIGDSILSSISMPLSVAVNVSARFPVLEPPGMLSAHALENVKIFNPYLRDQDTKSLMFDYFVDGGYADNFGATAIGEVLSAVKKVNCDSFNGAACNRADNAPWIETLVIQLTNDQSIVVDGWNSGRCINAPELRPTTRPGKVSDIPYFNELESPILALSNARETRGLSGAASLKERSDYYLHFRLSTATEKEYRLAPGLSYPKDDQPPTASLNWVLSPTSRQQIEGRLKQCGFLRTSTIKQILRGDSTINAVKKADDAIPILTDNWPDDR